MASENDGAGCVSLSATDLTHHGSPLRCKKQTRIGCSLQSIHHCRMSVGTVHAGRRGSSLNPVCKTETWAATASLYELPNKMLHVLMRKDAIEKWSANSICLRNGLHSRNEVHRLKQSLLQHLQLLHKQLCISSHGGCGLGQFASSLTCPHCLDNGALSTAGIGLGGREFACDGGRIYHTCTCMSVCVC